MNALDVLDEYLRQCIRNNRLTVIEVDTIVNLTQDVYEEGKSKGYTEGFRGGADIEDLFDE